MLYGCGGSAKTGAGASRDSTADAGFVGPENLVLDSTANVLLVANMNGDPMQKDSNGFISRVDLNGHVVDLKWIDGSRPQTRLDAPKGLAIHGDTLFVDDIDQVRLFDRNTGAALGTIAVTGSKMLNDLTFDAAGTLYTTDTQGSTIYKRAGNGMMAVAQGSDLQQPDGIEPNGSDILVAPLGGNEVYRVTPGGLRGVWVTLATGKLDGLQSLGDGSFLVTSWQGKKVYHIGPNGAVSDVADDIESPAGVAFDRKTRTVYVTSLNTNRLYRIHL